MVILCIAAYQLFCVNFSVTHVLSDCSSLTWFFWGRNMAGAKWDRFISSGHYSKPLSHVHHVPQASSRSIVPWWEMDLGSSLVFLALSSTGSLCWAAIPRSSCTIFDNIVHASWQDFPCPFYVVSCYGTWPMPWIIPLSCCEMGLEWNFIVIGFIDHTKL